MKTTRLLAAVVLLCALPGVTFAQVHPNIERGLPAGRMLNAGEIDSINTFNGSASLTIPIGQRWDLGGGTGYQLSLNMNTNVWDLTHRTLIGGIVVTAASPNRLSNAGMGWFLSLGWLFAPATPVFNDDPNKWLYVDPHGGAHYFYTALHEGETPVSTFWYSRDGSYLRLHQETASSQWVELPDGSVHQFELSNGLWRFKSMFNRYVDGSSNSTDKMTVTYGTNYWQITDTMGRTTTVNFETGPAGDTRVTTVVLPGVSSLTPTYSFAYTDISSLPRSCIDDDPQTSANVAVSLLSSVTLPDGSSYQFLSYNQTNATSCVPPNMPGTLSSFRLPTGGRIDYTYINYDFPYGCSGNWDVTLKWTAGIGTRQLYDGATTPTLLGTWTYQRPSEQVTSQQVTTIVTSPQPVPNGECSGNDCAGNDTVFYFRTVECKSTTDWSGWDYGLPFALGTSHTGDFTAYLSSRSYQGSSTSGTLKRSNYVLFEHDKLPSTISEDWSNSDRRLAGQKTVYEDDGSPAKYTDTRFVDYDGLGHYRVSVTGGTFGSGNTRRARTNLNEARGTYKITSTNSSDSTYSPYGQPSTYNPTGCNVYTTCDSPPNNFSVFPTNSPWILSTFTFTEATEDSVTAHQDYCFLVANGFLTRVRAFKTGATAGSSDVVAVYTADDHGNVSREQYYGGDIQTLNTTSLCTLTLPSSDQYRIDYDRGTSPTYGDRFKARYYDGSGNPLTFYFADVDLDRDTGLPTASRDSAGIQTSYEYDAMGRPTWAKPTSGNGAWLENQYVTWSTSDYARVESCAKPNGTSTVCSPSSDSLARSSTRYDNFGRPFLAKTLLASGSWNMQKTAFSVLGFPRWISEWFPDGTADASLGKTVLSGFDPFSRPATITPPDGSSHAVTITWTGARQLARTVKVGTSRDGSGNIIESTATTTETYDRQGRLASVQEPSGTSGAQITTSYTYDVGNRLYQASTTSGSTTQTRTFTYDNRSFLSTEVLPEAGASGNGTVTYSSYDARGHVHRLRDGQHDVAFTFDRAERLTQVAQADGSGNPSTPILKELTYATANGTGDYRNGKLVTALMHNMVSTTDYPVTESYVYGGVGGRVSSRTTSVEGHTITQAFSWNDLGQPASVGYPDTNLLTSTYEPSRTVSFTYTNGFLTRVPSFTHATNSITYHPNFMVNAIPHVNNVTVTQAADTSTYLPRPASISTSGASPNWGTGAYSFDGSNNIVKMGSDWFIFDPVSRMASGRILGGTLQQDATYDAFGFMLSMTTNGSTQNFTPVSGTNHISGTNNYDAAGNMLFWGSYTYSWDRLNELQKLSGTAADHSYFYSADGERIVEREGPVASPTTTTVSIRGLDGKVLRIYTKSGGSWSWTKDYVYRGGALLATVEPPVSSQVVKHFALDHLGTPRWITNSSGTKIAEHTYYPFGTEASGTTDWEKMKFTGQERDLQGTSAQGDDLDYLHARYYNFNIGRFLSLDPVRGDPHSPQSFNLFAYVRNDPVDLVDPSGLNSVKDWVNLHVQEETITVTASPLDMFDYLRTIFKTGVGDSLTSFVGRWQNEARNVRYITPNDFYLVRITQQSERPCPLSFATQVTNAVVTANMAFPGALMPTGMGLATTGTVGAALGLPTPMGWALGGFGAAPELGLATSFETGFGAASASVASFALAGSAYELGIVGGSLVGVALNGVPCEY